MLWWMSYSDRHVYFRCLFYLSLVKIVGNSAVKHKHIHKKHNILRSVKECHILNTDMIKRKLYKSAKSTAGIDFVMLPIACFVIVMLLTQLFSFEDMPKLLAQALDIPNEVGMAGAFYLVLFELLALPFLLRMKVSPLMKFCGFFCLLSVLLSWIAIGLITNLNEDIVSVGLFGSIVVCPPGWWLSCMLLAIATVVSVKELVLPRYEA